MIRPHFVIALSLVVLALTKPTGTRAATIDLDWQVFLHLGTTIILEGDTVRWTWQDSFAHSVRATGGLFDSGVLSGLGTQYSFTFTTQGSYPYFCAVHGQANMDGTIQVVPPSSVEGSSWARIKNLYR